MLWCCYLGLQCSCCPIIYHTGSWAYMLYMQPCWGKWNSRSRARSWGITAPPQTFFVTLDLWCMFCLYRSLCSWNCERRDRKLEETERRDTFLVLLLTQVRHGYTRRTDAGSLRMEWIGGVLLVFSWWKYDFFLVVKDQRLYSPGPEDMFGFENGISVKASAQRLCGTCGLNQVCRVWNANRKWQKSA